LDKDRWTYLAVQAYTKGLVSFDSAERSDDRWQLREEILLSEVERSLLAKLHEMVHLAESSAAQYISQSAFDHHYGAAKKQYQAFSKLMYPFGTDNAALGQNTIEALTKLWVQEFGDPDSPEVHETIMAMRKGFSGE